MKRLLLMQALSSAGILLCAFATFAAASSNEIRDAPPEHGVWRGFKPGTWAVVKMTYRHWPNLGDSVAYQKWALLGAAHPLSMHLGSPVLSPSWYGQAMLWRSASADGPWDNSGGSGIEGDWRFSESDSLRQADDEDVVI